MAHVLYRLGRFASRRRGLVLVIWVALVAAAGTGAVTLAGSATDSFRIPGTPAQQTIDLLAERFPQAGVDGATARVVLAAPAGTTLTAPAQQAAVARVVADLKTLPQVSSVSDPFVTKALNPTLTMGLAQVTFAVQSTELDQATQDAVAELAPKWTSKDLRVEVGGDALQPKPETGIGEVIGIAVAGLVLVLTFGSLIAAGLPLLTAVVGIGVGLAGVSIATGFTDVSSNAPVLASMIGLAVGIDYALFIVSRYRHEVAVGREPQEAAGLAVGTAGSAVVFAGLTVLIALSALAVVGIPFLTQMGLAASATVAVAVIVALTLLPALLGFLGRRITGGRVPGLTPHDPEADGDSDSAADSNSPADGVVHRRTFGHRWVSGIAKAPIVVVVACLAALAVIAVPARDMQLGMPDDSSAPPNSTQRKAYDLLAEGFGPGFNGPLVVVVTTAAGQAQAAAGQLAQRISGVSGVVAAVPSAVNPAGDTALLTVIPTTAPSAVATENLVRTLRALDGTVPGAAVGVTGRTAVNIDISEKLKDAMLPYLGVVVGLAFVLLLLVFRSILVPLKAALGFLLSVAAAFGAVVAVFQWGWLNDQLGISSHGPLISFLPIFLIGIAFGLAMDYEVFLVSRMREEFVHGAPARQAVVNGFSHGARVVSAAAVIMISVFAGFMTSTQTFIQAIGFSLAAAVFFDALVVRMTLVPAVMALLGRAAWWIPGWLDAVLPKVDIEGEGLVHVLDGGPAGSTSTGGSTGGGSPAGESPAGEQLVRP